MIIKFNNYETILKLNEAINTDVMDQKALGTIRRCYTQIITNLGFFADLLFQLNMVEARPGAGIETMATDGKSIVYWPPFVNSLTQEEVSFVIIHEIMHNANFHFARQAGRNHDLWNQAADYAINIQIDDMAKELPRKILKAPGKILLDEAYRNMSAEQVYDILAKKNPPPQQGGGQGKQGQGQGQPKPGQGQGQGQPKPGQGQGQGQGQPGQPGQGQPGQGQGGDGSPAPGDIRKPGSLDGAGTQVYEGNNEMQDSKSAQELEDKWAIARKVAGQKNIGTGSGSMDRWIKKINKSKVNWKVELKKFVSSIYDEKDYAYFNKNYIDMGDYISGIKDVDTSTFDNVVIAIDTSGSITEETLAKFGAELMKIFKTYTVNNCYVIWCDSTIPRNGVQLFKVADKNFKLDKLQPVGGGGTSFKPPFAWVQKNLIKKGKIPAFMIYFTDACGDAPSPNEYDIKRYVKKTLWVITENDDASNIKFGKKIYIDKILTT